MRAGAREKDDVRLDDVELGKDDVNGRVKDETAVDRLIRAEPRDYVLSGKLVPGTGAGTTNTSPSYSS